MPLGFTSLDPLASVRQAVQRPLKAAFGTDRFPEEQYTSPVGDPGLFGPASVTWRIHGDASMLLGGFCAAMLQSLHPLAMAGVAEHSDWRQRTFQRLSRTSSFVTATTFAATPVAEALIETVKAVHTKVHGIAPDGRPYRADDPDLLRWVHVAEMWSFLAAHRRYGLLPVGPADQDRYYDEVRVVAERLGATDVPASRAEVDAYFDAIRPQLRAGPQAQEAVGYFTQGHFKERSLRLSYQVVVSAAIGLLPEWARRMLRFNNRPFRELATSRVSALALLGMVRVAGTPSLAVRQSYERCGVDQPAVGLDKHGRVQ